MVTAAVRARGGKFRKPLIINEWAGKYFFVAGCGRQLQTLLSAARS